MNCSRKGLAMRYFYPRSPCGERLRHNRLKPRQTNFYPRSPCGERLNLGKALHALPLFLSTLSLRRATKLPTALRTPHQRFLSTLSLRRATILCVVSVQIRGFLSTLSLRRATGIIQLIKCGLIFLSTLSLRRATSCTARHT